MHRLPNAWTQTACGCSSRCSPVPNRLLRRAAPWLLDAWTLALVRGTMRRLGFERPVLWAYTPLVAAMLRVMEDAANPGAAARAWPGQGRANSAGSGPPREPWTCTKDALRPEGDHVLPGLSAPVRRGAAVTHTRQGAARSRLSAPGRCLGQWSIQQSAAGRCDGHARCARPQYRRPCTGASIEGSDQSWENQVNRRELKAIERVNTRCVALARDRLGRPCRPVVGLASALAFTGTPLPTHLALATES